MTENKSRVVVLGTGGTIAGWAPDPKQAHQYRAGEVAVGDLVKALAPQGLHIETEDVARIDSKNMNWTVWQQLVARLTYWLAHDDVQGVVVTHGTDTLEETAILLHSLLKGDKTVVITGAMRAANAPDCDGPVNLQDAIRLAATPGRAGVVAVFAGHVHAPASLTKLDCQSLRAFASSDPVPIEPAIENLTALRERFSGQPDHPVDMDVSAFLQVTAWPRVELVHNHAAQDGWLVRTLIASPDAPKAWVVAGTGNGTLSQGLEDALIQAQEKGAWVWRTSRCPWGSVQAQRGDRLSQVCALNPCKARVVVTLALLALALKQQGLARPLP